MLGQQQKREDEPAERRLRRRRAVRHATPTSGSAGAAPLSAKPKRVLSTIGANPGTTRVKGAACSNQPKMTAPPSSTSRAPTIPESGMPFFQRLAIQRVEIALPCPFPRESSDSAIPSIHIKGA